MTSTSDLVGGPGSRSPRRGVSWRYPDRQRCLQCRGHFGFEVVDGLYCSRKCARVPQISADPAQWPREHFTYHLHTGVRREKRDWLSQRAAEAAAARFAKQAYQCTYCLGWHIGSARPGETYAAPPTALG